MPICTLLVSTLILFAAFLPPRVNGDTEGRGAVTGGGVRGGRVIGIVVAGLASAMLACAGGGVRGNGVEVTGGWLWTAYLEIPPVSGELPGFQSLEEILAAG